MNQAGDFTVLRQPERIRRFPSGALDRSTRQAKGGGAEALLPFATPGIVLTSGQLDPKLTILFFGG